MKRLALLAILLPLFFGGCTQSVTVSDDIATNITYTRTGRTVDILYDQVLSTRDAWRIHEIVKQNRADHLKLHLFNPGGNAFVMLDVLHVLEQLESENVHITTIARGVIASAAVPVFAMGQERIITKDSWVMMHPGGWKGSEERVGERTMRVYEAMEKRYAQIISDRTDFTYGEVAGYLNIGNKLKNEHGVVLNSRTGVNWFNAYECLEKNLATQVV